MKELLETLESNFPDDFNWSEVLKDCLPVDGYLIAADTMSVILEDSTSVTCSFYIIDQCGDNYDYLNLTLQLFYEKPTLCGFPWNFETYDRYEDYLNEEIYDYNSGCEFFITEAIEKVALNQLKESIERQFKDDTFKDRTSKERKKEILSLFK